MIVVVREKKELLSTQLEQFIQGNGKEDLEMVKVQWFGLIMHDMKVCGHLAKQSVRVNSTMLMVTFMKENGIIINAVVSECI